MVFLAFESFLHPELKSMGDDTKLLINMLQAVVVVGTDSNSGRLDRLHSDHTSLALWPHIDQHNHVVRQEPGHAGQEHQLQECCLGVSW